jgi:hypothetical protein
MNKVTTEQVPIEYARCCANCIHYSMKQLDRFDYEHTCDKRTGDYRCGAIYVCSMFMAHASMTNKDQK